MQLFLETSGVGLELFLKLCVSLQTETGKDTFCNTTKHVNANPR